MTLHPGRRRTKATKFIWSIADQMHASGITVDADSAMSTVAIDAPNSDGVFLQGDDADSFCDSCKALWNQYPSLPMDVCEYAIAEKYCDLL